MKQAYSVQQVAGLLGASPEVTRALVGVVLGEARDVVSVDEVARIREAHRLGQRGGVPGAIELDPGSLEPRSLGGRRITSTETAQGVFDFGTPARGTGWLRPLRRHQAERHEADELFSRAVRLEAKSPLEALQAYAEAIASDPRHADAHVNRGRLLHQQGQLIEAEAHYVAALVAHPTDTTATFNLAVVLEDLGRVDDAIERYHQAIELDASCADAYFNLARLYEHKGEKMAAIRHLKDYKRLLGQRT